MCSSQDLNLNLHGKQCGQGLNSLCDLSARLKQAHRLKTTKVSDLQIGSKEQTTELSDYL